MEIGIAVIASANRMFQMSPIPPWNTAAKP